MRIIGYDFIQTRRLSLSNSHSNVASIQKNQGDKSHRVIVALGPVTILLRFHTETMKTIMKTQTFEYANQSGSI